MGKNWLGHDNGFTDAKWTNGKRTITGEYRYNWNSNCFTIILDKKNRYTGERERFTIHEDEPEWDNWKLVKD